jgi:hypothetical protein
MIPADFDNITGHPTPGVATTFAKSLISMVTLPPEVMTTPESTLDGTISGIDTWTRLFQARNRCTWEQFTQGCLAVVERHRQIITYVRTQCEYKNRLFLSALQAGLKTVANLAQDSIDDATMSALDVEHALEHMRGLAQERVEEIDEHIKELSVYKTIDPAMGEMAEELLTRQMLERTRYTQQIQLLGDLNDLHSTCLSLLAVAERG